LEQFLYKKVDFRGSDFEAPEQLQIEVKQKMHGRSVTLGVKSVKNILKEIPKNLMTPTPV